MAEILEDPTCVDCGKNLPDYECEPEELPDGTMRCLDCVIDKREEALSRLKAVREARNAMPDGVVWLLSTAGFGRTAACLEAIDKALGPPIKEVNSDD